MKMNLPTFLAMLETAADQTKDLVAKLQEAGRTDYALGATMINATFAVARGVVCGATEVVDRLERIAKAQEATAHALDGAFDMFAAKPLEGLAPRWVKFTLQPSGELVLVQAAAVKLVLDASPATALWFDLTSAGGAIYVKESLDAVFRTLSGLGWVGATGAELLEAWDAARPEGLSDESVQATLDGTGRTLPEDEG
jgi:hypothetical protein